MKREMQERTFTQHPQSHEESVAEAEASLDTQAITGKDKTRIAALAYLLYEQCGAGRWGSLAGRTGLF